MATPGTGGAAGAPFARRGRAVTRPRAGPRMGTDLARRPETLSSASRRCATRFGALATFDPDRRGRAGFFPRVFAAFLDLVLAAVFFAALLFADDFRAAVAAFFFFFLGLVAIRIAVSRRRAERAISHRARRVSGRGRRRRRRSGLRSRGRRARRCGFARRWLLRCGFLFGRGLLPRSGFLLRRGLALRTSAPRGGFLLRRGLLGLLLRFRLFRFPLASHECPPHDSSRLGATARGEPSRSRLAFYVAILILRESFARLRTCASACGTGPPYAQSMSSTVCTIGMPVAPASWVMQPILPVAITSAPVRSRFAALRSRSAAAMSGCIML